MKRARAIVTLTLEIEVDDRWGDDCPLVQVYSQAKDSAIGQVRHASQAPVLVRRGTTPVGFPAGWTLIGEPKVRSVITEEDR